MSTYSDGNPPEKSAWFFQWLEEASTDFRTDKSLLSNMKFAVFGCGNSEFGENFNSVAKHLHENLCVLEAKPIASVYLGDETAETGKRAN